ncbi:MAG: NRDE family protein [bacterium]|nr:NRDE family protein [bacterium]
MCLIFLAHDCHPDYRLILASNRDEFYARPTESAGFWEDHPGVFGGRDLEQGGTWLGMTRSGRFATVTNFRDPEEFTRKGLSRGLLLKDLLTGPLPVADFLARLQSGGSHGGESESARPADPDASAGDDAGQTQDRFDAQKYNGFNLLSGDLVGDGGLYWHSNKAPRQLPHRLVAGVYGLSNHLLDTPWPKVVAGRTAFTQIVAGAKSEGAADWLRRPDVFFDLLADSTTAPDAALPDTGIGLEKERFLSSRFIQSDVYGTRASSLLLVRRDGLLTFFERRFEAGGKTTGDSRYEFQLGGASGA